jgi:rubrerythrin
VDFANSETLKNLLRAFAGETRPANATPSPPPSAASRNSMCWRRVFQFTAHQEKEHSEIFYRHMKPFAGGTVAIDGGYPWT